MMKSIEKWETDKLKAIEDVLKQAREELIRRNLSKSIFEDTINKLIHIVYSYSTEKNEAIEVIIDDAKPYLIKLTSVKNQILPPFYPKIFSLHLYP